MMVRLLRWLFAFIIIVVSVCGCTRMSRTSVFDCVPSDVVSVKAVDFERMICAAGIEVPADCVMSDSLYMRVAGLSVPPAVRDAFMSVVGTAFDDIDLKHVISFTSASGADVLAVGVTDEDALIGALSRMACVGSDGVHHEDGFACVSLHGCMVALRDGVCFMSSSINAVNDALAVASSSPVASLPGVFDFLNDDGVVRLAVNCGRSPMSYLGGVARWLCVETDVTGESVRLDAKVIDSNGAIDSIGANFAEIDTSFLRFVPEDASVTVAFGRFDGNVRALSMLLGRFTPVYMRVADGTTALFAMPVGDAEAVAADAPGAWDVATITRVPSSVVDSCLHQYEESAGAQVYKIGDSLSTYSDNGNERCYFGAYGNDVVFAVNRPISPDYVNSGGDDFQGRRLVMNVNIPQGSVLQRAWRLDSGLTFNVSLYACRLTACISFDNDSGRPLADLLRLPMFYDAHERFKAHAGL